MRPFDDRAGFTTSPAGYSDVRDIRPDTTFELLRGSEGLSGVDQLPAELTIPGNGNTVLPTFRYRLGDADATDLDPWGYGETLTAQGSGGTFNAGSPFLGSSDDSYNPDGTRYFQASGNSFADIGTEDFVIEMVLQGGSGTGFLSPLTKRDGADEGYRIDDSNASLFRIAIEDDGGSVTFAAGSNFVTGAWYHLLFIIDRSGSGIIYQNAVAGTATSVTSIGSMANPANLTVGAIPVGTNGYDAPIAYLALYKGEGLLDSHLQAALVQSRFQRLCGLQPRRAVGTKAWTSYTRATTAVVDKVEYGSELLPSTDPTSGWTEARASVALDTSVSHPEGATVYALSEDDTGANTHLIREDGISVTAGVEYELSVDVKAGLRNWVATQLSNSSGAFSNELVSFNASTGASGTASNSPISYSVEALSNDWYRLRVRGLADATVGTARIAIYIGEADNDVTFSGLDQVSLYIANPTMRTWESKLYTMGAGLPRMAYRQEATSGADFKGYLVETAATNLITYSHEFDNAAWAKTRATVTANSVVAPDGTTTADTLAEDNTLADSHFIRETHAFAQVAGTTYTYPVYLKAANRTWGRVQVYSPTDGIASADFDLSTGTVGTTAAIDSSGIEPVGNGWFRCWIRDTRATAELISLYVYALEADNDLTFDGLTQDSLYVWGAQVEADVDYPTSIIQTSGATATRNADVLYYLGDDGNVANNQQGTMECEVLRPDVAVAATIGAGVTLNDGGSANNRIDTLLTSADKWVSYIVRDSGVEKSTAGPPNVEVSDGDAHTLRFRWKTDSGIDSTDGTEGTEDTSMTAPDDLDRVLVGTSTNAGREINGVLRNIRIWPYPTTKEGT